MDPTMDTAREKHFQSLPLHERLKYLRENNKKTQKEIAEMLCVDRSTYAYYESGKTEPRLASIIRLANYYNISLDRMLKDLREVDEYDFSGDK